MDGTNAFIMVQLPLVILVGSVIGTIAWNRNGNAVSVLARGSPPGAKLLAAVAALALWLVLTVTSVWLALLYGFVACHLLLFWLGRLAAGLGFISVGAIILSVPFVWGWVLWKSALRH